MQAFELKHVPLLLVPNTLSECRLKHRQARSAIVECTTFRASLAVDCFAQVWHDFTEILLHAVVPTSSLHLCLRRRLHDIYCLYVVHLVDAL